MQIEVQIDENCKKPKVIIQTDEMTEEVSQLIQKLSKESRQIIAGICNDTVKLLDQSDIIRIVAMDGKVFASTLQQEYQIRLRLYELESCLNKKIFVRISNSEIINLKKVKEFDLKFTGTICVFLSNNTVTYVSRRYVSKIKQVLGI